MAWPRMPSPWSLCKLRQLQQRRRTDNRRRKKECEARRVLVREADEQTTTHGGAPAGEARDQRDGCGCANTNACGNRLSRQYECRRVGWTYDAADAGLRRRTAEPVEDEEERSRCAEAKTLRSKSPGGDQHARREWCPRRAASRASHRVPCSATAVTKASANPRRIRFRLAEEDEQHDRCGEVGRDQKGDEVVVICVDVPAEKLGRITL